jgi:hypothetical protein
MAERPKRPTKVLVGGLVYRVKYDEASLKAAKARELEDLNGHCANDQLLITVDGSMAEPNVREILLHEILHACHWAAGAPLTLMKEDDPEEGLVRVLSPRLMGVLRNNPDVLEYLLGE